MSIKELKKLYLKESNSTDLSMEEIRFFYAGKELKEDFYIYSYDIKDEMTVQVMVRKVAN